MVWIQFAITTSQGLNSELVRFTIVIVKHEQTE